MLRAEFGVDGAVDANVETEAVDKADVVMVDVWALDFLSEDRGGGGGGMVTGASRDGLCRGLVTSGDVRRTGRK